MDPVSEAFRAVPREGFLPVSERGRAAYDGPIPIGHGQTNSQPRTVADMLRLLDVRRGQHVLDVGSGSGWTTALLAHLVGPDGSVIGVELEPDLVAWGRDNLRRAVRDDSRSAAVRIEQAVGGVFGWPDDAPYDRILVSAEATRMPQTLIDQLAVVGRMVVPVNGRMMLVEHAADGDKVTEQGYYSFVPLR